MGTFNLEFPKNILLLHLWVVYLPLETMLEKNNDNITTPMPGHNFRFSLLCYGLNIKRETKNKVAMKNFAIGRKKSSEKFFFLLLLNTKSNYVVISHSIFGEKKSFE